jgi:DNA invertase Pin-like site-specific DNA recombinase
LSRARSRPIMCKVEEMPAAKRPASCLKHFEDVVKVAAYVRVSSRQQKTDSQEAEIVKWLDGHGVHADQVEWYRDKESGKTLARPEFDRLQKDIFNGRVKTVVLWKLDRLSRRLRDGVNLLSDWCDKGLRVIVTTQQIDLSGPVGRMIAAVLLGLAEIELEFKNERQAAGIEVAKKRGVYKGRKKGTTKAKPRRAQELREQGLTVPEIATALGTSERTIWRYLTPASNLTA